MAINGWRYAAIARKATGITPTLKPPLARKTASNYRTRLQYASTARKAAAAARKPPLIIVHACSTPLLPVKPPRLPVTRL